MPAIYCLGVMPRLCLLQHGGSHLRTERCKRSPAGGGSDNASGLKAQDAQVLFKLVPEGCVSEGSCCHSRHVNLCGLGVPKPKFVRTCEKATCHDVIAAHVWAFVV